MWKLASTSWQPGSRGARRSTWWGRWLWSRAQRSRRGCCRDEVTRILRPSTKDRAGVRRGGLRGCDRNKRSSRQRSSDERRGWRRGAQRRRRAHCGHCGRCAGKLSMLALTASLAKWIALGSVVGGAGLVAFHALTDEAPPALPAPSAAPPVAPVATGAKAVPAARATREAATDVAATGAPAARAPAAARSPATRSGTSAAAAARAGAVSEASAPEALPAETLAQEIAGIDRARSLLAAGRYAATAAALDDYERRFSQAPFHPRGALSENGGGVGGRAHAGGPPPGAAAAGWLSFQPAVGKSDICWPVRSSDRRGARRG